MTCSGGGFLHHPFRAAGPPPGPGGVPGDGEGDGGGVEREPLDLRGGGCGRGGRVVGGLGGRGLFTGRGVTVGRGVVTTSARHEERRHSEHDRDPPHRGSPVVRRARRARRAAGTLTPVVPPQAAPDRLSGRDAPPRGTPGDPFRARAWADANARSARPRVGRVGAVSRRLPPTRQDLIRWAEALSGIARTGLGFTQSLYERERFDEVLAVAGDIRAAAQADEGFDAEHFVDEWMQGAGEGVAGYITPKVAVGAVVHNDAGEILLVQRADSGIWLYPTGWADVGYSASEIAVKEVKEETGIDCRPVRLIALLDGLRLGFTRVPLYSLVFLCRAVGGDLQAHPLECADVGWFGEDKLPAPLAGVDQWGRQAFAAI